jgi:hypothetical protein
MRFAPEELINMVKTCNVNHLTQFGTFLSLNIKAARGDPIILKLLQGMKTVSYDGVPISPEDDGWCFKNRIPLVVSISLPHRSSLTHARGFKEYVRQH